MTLLEKLAQQLKRVIDYFYENDSKLYAKTEDGETK
jgi:hypothetical protein